MRNAQMHIFDFIREKTSLAVEVAKYLYLHPSEGNLKGSCPWHQDYLSFVVLGAPRSLIHKEGISTFECHVCSARGDVIDFTARMLGITYFDAAVHLLEGYKKRLEGCVIEMDAEGNLYFEGKIGSENWIFRKYIQQHSQNN